LKVIVIGAGPAGLAAAHAALGAGAKDVQVIAPKRKTPQQGPLLIQRPIPGINTDHPDGTIHQVVIGGSILDYRYKLYGDINIGINGDILKPQYHAWRHAETYDLLWREYERAITDHMVKPSEMAVIHETADLVVSTANARPLCRNPKHRFTRVQVAITPYAEYAGGSQPDNTIIFNAGHDAEWTRSSKIFGNEVTEWAPSSRVPSNARIIEKPISTDCDCYPHVLRTGRFGRWQNEVWVDTAYWDTYTAVEGMLRSAELDGIG
jgi:hypothetical protein